MATDRKTTIPPAPDEGDSLAEAVRKISQGFDRLKKSGLNRKAVVVLLHDATKVARRDIELVLDSLGDLAKRYTT